MNNLRWNKDLTIHLIDEKENKCLGTNKDGLFFLGHYDDKGNIFHKHVISSEQMKEYIENKSKLIEKVGV